MAGELLVVNPRGHRRRRAKKAVSFRRRKSHRRRRIHALSNPRRRRRAIARRRHHRNPSFGRLGGGLTAGLKTGLGIGVGVVATEIGSGAAIKYIPGIPAMLTSGIGKSILKVAVGGLALPFILKKVGQHTLARNVAIGAWVAVTVDLLHQYVTPALGLSEYSMSEYIPSGISGDGLAPEEVGSAENMYGDTMYGY